MSAYAYAFHYQYNVKQFGLDEMTCYFKKDALLRLPLLPKGMEKSLISFFHVQGEIMFVYTVFSDCIKDLHHQLIYPLTAK